MGLTGKILAADMSPLSAAFHMADNAFVVPRCTDAAFVPTMLEICRKHEVRLVVPTIDTELPVYAAHRGDFEDIGTTVAVSAPESISMSADKESTHEWLTGRGFPTIRQTTPARLRLGDEGSEGFTFPLVVKPRRGSASIGVAIVNNSEELKAATAGGDFVLQTIASGGEYTVDVFVDRSGTCRCAVPRRRVEVRAGEVSKAITKRKDDLMELARRIVETMPHTFGVLNVQVFLDESSGQKAVIEINPRFGGGFPLAWQAGADFPRWLIQEVLGQESEASWDSWSDGLVMLRYDEAVFVSSEKVGL
jgi:carbamoyl-phosphate synthase large subunit